MEKQITEEWQKEQQTTGEVKREAGSTTASVVKNGIIICIIRKLLLSIVCFAVTVTPVIAITLRPPGHTWEYTFTDPTGNPAWNTTTGVGDTWSSGPAPFGNNKGGYPSADPLGQFDYATYWEADGSDGYDLWVRTSIDLTGVDLSSVLWDLGVDNGFNLYSNGVARYNQCRGLHLQMGVFLWFWRRPIIWSECHSGGS